MIVFLGELLHLAPAELATVVMLAHWTATSTSHILLIHHLVLSFNVRLLLMLV